MYSNVKIVSINRKTINSLLTKIRIRLSKLCEEESYFTSGEIEIEYISKFSVNLPIQVV